VTIIPDSTTVPPPVRAAIVALDAFGAISRRQARILLGYWAGRAQLTTADVDQVLTHYPVNVRPADPTGLTYQRDDDVPAVEPVPDHVDGKHITGRAADQ